MPRGEQNKKGVGFVWSDFLQTEVLIWLDPCQKKIG